MLKVWHYRHIFSIVAALILLLLAGLTQAAGQCKGCGSSLPVSATGNISGTPGCLAGKDNFDYDCNNSCQQLNTDGTVFNGLSKYVTTVPFYPIIDNNFQLMEFQGSICSGSAKLPTGCNVASNYICFSYGYGAATSPGVGTSCTCMSPGDQVLSMNDGLAQFQAVAIANQVCVQVLSPIGWQTIGCKYMPSTNTATKQTTACPSCFDASIRHTQSFFPITAALVECMKDTTEQVFITGQCPGNQVGDSGGSIAGNQGQQVNLLPKFQAAMQKSVMALLTLYVMFFGVKIATGQEVPRKSEVFMFIIKFVLVMYFSVGFRPGMSATDSAYDTYNGLRFLLNAFEALSSDLTAMVFNAADSSQLCNYGASCYQVAENGTNQDYSYLAIWDSLDCRIAYYLGFTDPQKIISYALLFAFGFWAIFIGQFLFIIFCVLFACFFIAFAVYLVNIYIVSMLAMNVLIYFGPLFVPMALFEVTKSYYDAWLKMIISFALQPVVVCMFLAISVNIFDQFMYQGCTFDSSCLGNYSFWTLNASTTDTCSKSLGYLMSLWTNNDSATQTIEAVFFNITALNPYVIADLMVGMTMMTLFGFLFYQFSAILGQFSASLTEGPNASALAINPQKMFTKLAGAAIDLGKALIRSGGPNSAMGSSVSVSADKSRGGGAVSVSEGSSNGGVSVSDGSSAAEGNNSDGASSGEGDEGAPPRQGEGES